MFQCTAGILTLAGLAVFSGCGGSEPAPNRQPLATGSQNTAGPDTTAQQEDPRGTRLEYPQLDLAIYVPDAWQPQGDAYLQQQQQAGQQALQEESDAADATTILALTPVHMEPGADFVPSIVLISEGAEQIASAADYLSLVRSALQSTRQGYSFAPLRDMVLGGAVYKRLHAQVGPLRQAWVARIVRNRAVCFVLTWRNSSTLGDMERILRSAESTELPAD